MIGTILNASAIILGGLCGLIYRKPLPLSVQMFFKVTLGMGAMFFGLRLTWLSLDGSFGQMVKQIGIAFLALMLGSLLGRLLRAQAGLNQLGQLAKKLIEATRSDPRHRFSHGMNACTILFCAAPLGVLGAIQDALPIVAGEPGYFYPLAVKALMDGLATMGFVMMFGSSAMVSAVPVFVFFGTITMATSIYLQPWLRAHELLNSVNAVGGLIVCVVGVVIFEIRRAPLADYFPALILAPLFTWWWK